MKNIVKLFCILCLVSCKKDHEKDYIILSGEIANKIQDYIVVSINNTEIKDTIQLSSTGHFIDTLKVDNGAHLISHGKVYLRPYFEKGYNVTLKFDANDFNNTLTYAGKGAEANNYILAKRQKELKLIKNRKHFYSLSEKDYKETVAKIKDTSISLLAKNLKISNDFRKKELRNIRYEYINNLLSYEEFHNYFTKDNTFKVSEQFLPDLKDFDFNNGDDYLFSSAYKRILNINLKKTAKTLIEENKMPRDIANLKEIAAIQNDTIRNSLLYSESVYGITYTSSLDEFYKIFMEGSTNSDHKATISDNYKKLKKVEKGQVSPQFVDYKNYSGGTKSLSDFKGKYVYIDVWATWCAPCKKEIPSLKEIEKTYHNKNIEFISISIDKTSDYEKWKRMVSKENLGGVQLFADNAWESQFIQEYLIKGIPRFILLDPQGHILTANAPRPSEPELIGLFNELSI
ncbi:TlpA family protein disulfide reductase [Algibacter miyuki]|uniref:TlpA family protein disulfide reductase n=1 Tax=Algibacter miyuki TaxID=1306933 RepID=A0ABV5H4R1_9FLAO|nr:TlpA disulfide reductase family protein [Algibacter miyuki]MDN3665783.1 TlpA disulfide reductase family protein [Algibacter miyuki]